MTRLFLLFLVSAAGVTLNTAFAPSSLPSRVAASSTSLYFFKDKNYNKVVENIMWTKGLTREEAEKDYNKFLENPNNYALEKGEAYYKSLGYQTFMDGVIGEAEKEGRGEEVKERIAAFKRKSKLKAYAVISVSIVSFFYWKISSDIAGF